VEEPILLNSAGGSREIFSSGIRTFIAFVEEPTLLVCMRLHMRARYRIGVAQQSEEYSTTVRNT
jgi:hypothetical protein